MSFIRKILKLPVTAPLQIESVRNRVAFELKYKHFQALDLNLPLDERHCCPIRDLESLHSFQEVFVSGEYGDFLDLMPRPRRWVDLGCHLGYFSLYLAWQHAVRGWGKDYRALLADADPRAVEWARKTIRLNRMEEQLKARQGAVGAKAGTLRFALREGMGSSANMLGFMTSNVVEVPVMTAEELMKEFAPPYDLLKVDIEGGEVDLLRHYGPVLKATNYLLLEWHTWNNEGLGEQEILALVEKHGFTRRKVYKAAKAIELDGKAQTYGVDFYAKAGL